MEDQPDTYSNLRTLEKAICTWREEQRQCKETRCELIIQELELEKGKSTRFVAPGEVRLYTNGVLLDESHIGDLIFDVNTGTEIFEKTILTFRLECVLPHGWQLKPDFNVGCFVIAADSDTSQIFVSMSANGLLDASGIEKAKTEVKYDTDTTICERQVTTNCLKLSISSTTTISLRDEPIHRLFNSQLFKLHVSIQNSIAVQKYHPGSILLRTALVSNFSSFLNFVLGAITFGYFRRTTTLLSTLSALSMFVSSLLLTTVIILLYVDAHSIFQQFAASFKYFFYWWIVVIVHCLLSMAICVYFNMANEKYIISRAVSGKHTFVNDRGTVEFVIYFQTTSIVLILALFSISLLRAKKRLNNFLNLTLKSRDIQL
ncbi:hypothetical protein KL938_005012 [Ogataea parapolymorpha]|nr:hypothetical protein KL938_005012 [Ogataea parapolymorpha]